MSVSILTSRFNDETWLENCNYRKSHNEIACIYCSPQQITSKIEPNALLLIIEMNNSQNKIEGIGLIRNLVKVTKYYRVYDTCNFNRFTYTGKYRIDRDTLLSYNARMVEMFDNILFKNKTHVKRGCGLTRIPEKLLKLDICSPVGTAEQIKMELIHIFKTHHHSTKNTENMT